MIICAVQCASVAGDIATNIDRHLEWIEKAVAGGAQVVFFPELSLTGYQPGMAGELAMSIDDSRLDVFQQCSDEHGLLIGVGLPLRVPLGVQIAMAWISPGKQRRVYVKQTLHPDEEAFFVPGDASSLLEWCGHKMSPAICFEALQSHHAKAASRQGADVYLASVAKSQGGIEKAMSYFPSISKQLRLTVVMANATGHCEAFEAAGQSTAWSVEGQRIDGLEAAGEGILFVDLAADGPATVP
ncbi:carbon-nitrogen hydrolase family protein [Marinihelvus fidelis]|uniref:carbon-nitrogen hydrolase family protein n=1 Tax=Marinihelvus fidelis TaxID=2613842 RepID=UPI001CD4A24A|nr:carbon-nitrogen hydrolase family protein [Marinihelvus fidelis]